MAGFREKYLKTVPEGSVGIKICGITNPQDALTCVDAGVNALGFNFFPGSKRFLEIEKERKWLENVPASVTRVAVLVNPTLEDAIKLSRELFVDALQLHGEESPAFCRELQLNTGKFVIKAIRIGSAAMLADADQYMDFPILLDAFAGLDRGGTGQTFDWNLLNTPSAPASFILSGGLNPTNIGSALRLTKAQYVDVASGVENDPRRKSESKIHEFVFEVRKYTEKRPE